MGQDDIEFTVSAPGKIILMGEHIVLFKKRGIAASINKRTKLHFSEHKEAHEQIMFKFKGLFEDEKWDFKNLYNLVILDKPLKCDIKDFSLNTPELLDHDAFVEIIQEVVSQRPIQDTKKKALIGVLYAVLGMLWCTDIDISPFNLEIYSDLAIGAGTGSSASFAVCVAASIYNYIKVKAVQKHGYGETNICNEIFKPYYLKSLQENNGFSSEEKDLINRWAFCIEKINHGKPSGLDNTVCTYGHAVLLNTQNDSEEKPNMQFLDNLPSFRVLLVNTGVPRSTSDMVKKVVDLHKICTEATASILDSMDVIAKNFIEDAQKLRTLTEKKDIVETYRRLEVLIDMQHGHLRTLGVSHPRLDEICFITKRRGLSSKLTGAGGGGNAFTLVPTDAEEKTVSQAIQDLRSSGFIVEDIIICGDGLILHN